MSLSSVKCMDYDRYIKLYPNLTYVLPRRTKFKIFIIVISVRCIYAYLGRILRKYITKI